MESTKSLRKCSLTLFVLACVCLIENAELEIVAGQSGGRHKRQVLQRVSQILPGTSHRGPSTRCASQCKCYGDREIHCTFQLLSEVPADLPQRVVKINLAYNKIKRISPTALARTRSTLLFLFLQSNEIRSIHGGEFGGLSRLEVLRLSWNGISGIFKMSFDGLTALTRLHLDHNKITFIHPEAFLGLTSLTLLQLEGNKLAKLHADNFATVRFHKYFSFSHIQHLYLSDNEFEVLPQALLPGMSSLQKVYLNGNPWECTCQMQWLHQWMRESNKYRCKRSIFRTDREPECAVCASPKQLRGRLVQQVPFDNITCSAPRSPKPHQGAVQQTFDEDPTYMELQNEALLFRHGSRARESMTVRLDSPVSSLLLMHCNASREPETETGVEMNGNLTYVGSFELLMACSIDYPTDAGRLDDVVRPYLNAALNFSARGSGGRDDVRRHVDYKVQIQGDPTSPLQPRGSGLRIVSASLLEASDIISSSQFTITITSNRFRPEDRTLVLLFRNQVLFRPTPNHAHKDNPWVLLMQPYPAKQETRIAIERKAVVLNCRAMGAPRPKPAWILPNERVLRSGRRGGRFRVTSGGRLVLRRVKLDDAGVYYCMAKSATQSDVAEDIGSVRLHVVRAASAAEATARESAVIGESWRAGCAVDAAPEVTIAWRTPSRQLLISNSSSTNGETVHQDNSIEIADVQPKHAGIYSCIAANRMGAVMLPIRLDVIEDEVIEETEIEDEYFDYEDDLEIDFMVTPNMVDPLPTTLSSTPTIKPFAETKSSKPLSTTLPPKTTSTKQEKKVQSESTITIKLPTPRPTKRTTATVKNTTPTADKRTTKGTSKEATAASAKSSTVATKHLTTTRAKNTIKATTKKTTTAATTTTADTTTSVAFSTKSSITVATEAPTPAMPVSTRKATVMNSSPATVGSTTILTTKRTTEVSKTSTPSTTITSTPTTIISAITTPQKGITAAALKSGTSSTPSILEASEGSASFKPATATSQAPNLELFVTQAASVIKEAENAESSMSLVDASLTSIPNPQEKVATTSQGSPLKLTTDHGILSNATELPMRTTGSVTASTLNFHGAPSNTGAPEANAIVHPDLLSIVVQPSTAAPLKPALQASTDRLSPSESATNATVEATTNPATFAQVTAQPTTDLSSAAPENTVSEPIRQPDGVGAQEKGNGGHAIAFNVTAATRSTATEKGSAPFREAKSPATAASESAESMQIANVTGHGPGSVGPSGGMPTTSDFPRNPTARPKAQLNATGARGEWAPTVPGGFISAHDAAPGRAVAGSRLDGADEILIRQGTPQRSVSASGRGLRDSTAVQPSLDVAFSGELDSGDALGFVRPALVVPTARQIDKNISKIVREAPGPQRSGGGDRKASESDGGHLESKGRDDISFANDKDSGKAQIDGSPTEVAHQRRKETVQFRTSEIVANYGDSLMLQCPFNGESLDVVTWSFKGRGDQGGGLFEAGVETLGDVQDDSSQFQIKKLSLMHNGTFTCEMNNHSRNYVHETKLIIRTSPPRIVAPLIRRLTVDHGDSVNVTCQAEGIPEPEISWSWPRTASPNSNSELAPKVFTSPDKVLHIEKADKNSQVMFLCVASNAVGRTLHELNVVVRSSPPVITSRPKEVVTAEEGDDVSFPCAASGVPTPRMSWVLPEGQELTKADGASAGILILQNDTLVLRNASQRSKGRYRCVGRNIDGQASTQVTLTVMDKPKIVEESTLVKPTPAATTTKRVEISTTKLHVLPEKVYRKSIRAMVEETAFLHCRLPHERMRHRTRWTRFRGSLEWRIPDGRAAGFPTPIPTWRHRTLFNGTLRVRKLNVEDSGTYTCVARNKKGIARTIVEVTVETAPPRIRQRAYQSIVAAKNRMTGAECSASEGNPKPRIQWIAPNGRKYSSGSWGDGFYVRHNGKLVIRSMALSFAGWWRCVASNVAGNDTRLVNFKLPPFAPKIKRSRSWMNYVKVGRTAKIDCSAIGVPPPSYHWILPNGRRVVNNGAVRLNGRSKPKLTMLINGTLVINHAAFSDDGYYKCYASNVMGTNVKTLKLKVYR